MNIPAITILQTFGWLQFDIWTVITQWQDEITHVFSVLLSVDTELNI